MRYGYAETDDEYLIVFRLSDVVQTIAHVYNCAETIVEDIAAKQELFENDMLSIGESPTTFNETPLFELLQAVSDELEPTNDLIMTENSKKAITKLLFQRLQSVKHLEKVSNLQSNGKIVTYVRTTETATVKTWLLALDQLGFQ